MIAEHDQPLRDNRTLLGWNMTTYFMEDTHILDVGTHHSPVLRIRHKKIDDEDSRWERDEYRRIDVTPDQIVLMDDGSERYADELKVGDHVQNFCGNGHRNMIEGIDVREDSNVIDFLLAPHAFYVVRGGLILKADRRA